MSVGISVTEQVHIAQVLHLLLNVTQIHALLMLYFILPPYYSKMLSPVSQIRSRQLAHGDFIGRRSSRNAFIVAPLANLK